MTENYLDGMYPGIVPWYEAHPFRFSLYVAAGTIAAIIVAAVVLSVLMSPV